MALNREPETRWSWVEIDQGALRRNTRAFKNLLNGRQRLCCVVKADAYGHGATQCAKLMYATGADMFAVATVAEGVELRESGIKALILFSSEPPVTSIDTLLEHQIMPSIYSFEFALAYGERAVELGVVGRYHMAIETGMNRIGVHYADVLDFRRSIDFHRGIVCDGVFTHFATADEPDGRDFKLQCKRFEEAVAALKDAGFECGIVHCDNTPASILDPATHYDMIRAGIGLYGSAALRPHGAGLPARSGHERQGPRDARDASGDGRGSGRRLHLPGAACARAGLHPADRLRGRPVPHAVQPHGSPLSGQEAPPGGQHLHGPVHGRDPGAPPPASSPRRNAATS